MWTSSCPELPWTSCVCDLALFDKIGRVQGGMAVDNLTLFENILPHRVGQEAFVWRLEAGTVMVLDTVL